MIADKKRSPLNKTITLSEDELKAYDSILKKHMDDFNNRIFNTEVVYNDKFEAIINLFGSNIANLIFLDPPYNLTKDYGGKKFNKMNDDDYSKWFEYVIKECKRTLKKNGTIYVCSDWKTSSIIAPILKKYFYVHNRITWERDKGRGAKTNWKNNTEDIWFCTADEKDYTFNIEAVKIKRKVIAPFKNEKGEAKDWFVGNNGVKYRLTYPSNIWNDITIPFWSMPENTDHPTQKPEKLIARTILASSNEDDIVFDPFSGSGTTAVVAKKLNRRFIAIEESEYYSAVTIKRLEMADKNKRIQGYEEGIFWERNSQCGQS